MLRFTHSDESRAELLTPGQGGDLHDVFCRLLDWRERKTATTEHKTKYDKIVIVSHAFHPSEFEVRFNPFPPTSFKLTLGHRFLPFSASHLRR